MKKFFSVLKTVLLLVLLIVIGKYGFDEYQEYQAEKRAAEEVITVACVGDSNTYRHGGTNVQEYKYSYHLGKLLGEGYEVRNFGEVGTCVNPNGSLPYDNLRVYEAGIEYEADVLIVMLGTNDVWNYNWVSEGFFKQEYLRLIDSYLQAEHIPEIYLCTLPKIYQEDDTTSESNNGERIDILSNLIREIAKERGYTIVDVNQMTDNRLEWYAEDLLHINGDGAHAIADTIAEDIKDSIEVEGLENETEK